MAMRRAYSRLPEGAGRRLSVCREAQADLALARLRPARGHDLAARVEVERLRAVHVRVAEERVFPSAERERADGHGDGDVDPDHADLDVELELACGLAVAGEDGGA